MTEIMTGILDGLRPSLKDNQVEYQLEFLHASPIPLNPLLGKTLRLRFTGNKMCQGCGKAAKKFFQPGFCFVCSQRLACCDLCIVRPERCHFHLGTCREPDWGQTHCMQDHVVYLANSSGLKVGITRAKNIPTRWLDQGAVQALPVLRVDSRRLAGLIEVEFAKHLSDKTDWRKMLKGVPEFQDLEALRETLKMKDLIPAEYEGYTWLLDEKPRTFEYPVRIYPEKVVSLSFDRTPQIEGVLEGIKAKYLIFSSGVLNLRQFEGYELSLEGIES